MELKGGQYRFKAKAYNAGARAIQAVSVLDRLVREDTLTFFFSSRRRHTRWPRDWSSDVCSSDLSPLRVMVRDMQKLAAGDFNVVLPGLDRKDEIGAMAHAVEQFKVKAIERARHEADPVKQAAAAERKAEMHRLADGFEAAVGNMVTAVSRLSNELEGAASTLTGNADTTRQLSDVVAGASQEASVNVQSVAHATHELTSSVSEISRHVQESSRIATDAVHQADQTDR